MLYLQKHNNRAVFSTAALFLFLGLAPASTWAQSSSEVFGGFTYFRGDRDLISGVNRSPSLTGWQASYNYKFTPRFGVMAQGGGDYGTVRIASTAAGARNPFYQQHSLMGGPRVSLVSGPMHEELSG